MLGTCPAVPAAEALPLIRRRSRGPPRPREPRSRIAQARCSHDPLAARVTIPRSRLESFLMSVEQNTSIELIAPDRSRQIVRIAASPFLIGRGTDGGNHVQLNDRRISRQCAAIVSDGGHYYLENRGQKLGIFVNGEKVEHRQLNDGDIIS